MKCQGWDFSIAITLDEFVAKRRALAKRYDELLVDIPVNKPYQLDSTNSSWHLYIILLENEERKDVFNKMRAAGIGVNVHYIPIHTQPFYQSLGFKWGDFPIAEDYYYKRCLSIPIHPGLTEEEQDFVVKILKESL